MIERHQLALVAAIDSNKNVVRTKSLDLSFNELLDMYRSGELQITPEYQRLFRWSEGQQSRFIESLILEMPLPPIFMIEEENGRYELIDGLQRISSYLHFRGVLKAPHLEIAEGSKLKLYDCDIIGALNGLTIDDLPEAMVIRLKRMFIRVEVIRRESDRRLRYHMFKRLNTGGDPLSAQEVRNCTIRLLDDKFNAFIGELAKNEDFKNCIRTISDEQRYQLFDHELVLRFFTFKNIGDQYTHDVGDFMTEYMERVSEGKVNFDYGAERTIFERTFAVLSRTLGENAFGWMSDSGQLVARFSVYHYEAFSIGLQAVIDRLDPDDSTLMEKVKEVLLSIKGDNDFKAATKGGGKNSKAPWEKRVGTVKRFLLKAV